VACTELIITDINIHKRNTRHTQAYAGPTKCNNKI
jgi:hypothetical protein